jgi:hypothetical protein
VIAGAGLLTSASNPTFSPHEKAAYLESNLVNFVRPGSGDENPLG